MTMKRNDDAVSPVIGVILMVAITVILAAVIAAFVFGLVGSVEGAKVVGVTANKFNDTHIQATWQGGPDITDIVDITGRFDGTAITNTTTEFRAGSITWFYDGTDVTGKRFTLAAAFKDGTEQVLFDKQF